MAKTADELTRDRLLHADARFRYDTHPDGAAAPFTQTIDLLLDGEPVATARWHAADRIDGVAQLLDIHVRPGLGRRGHGSVLLDEVTRQIRQFFASGQGPGLRRIWCTVRQKQCVIARAFFMTHGWQHIHTISNVAANEDLLVFVKTFN